MSIKNKPETKHCQITEPFIWIRNLGLVYQKRIKFNICNIYFWNQKWANLLRCEDRRSRVDKIGKNQEKCVVNCLIKTMVKIAMSFMSILFKTKWIFLYIFILNLWIGDMAHDIYRFWLIFYISNCVLWFVKLKVTWTNFNCPSFLSHSFLIWCC